jgi:hypothetical protein
MKLIKIFLFFLPIFSFSQEIIKCNDSINFIVKDFGSENYGIKVKGNVEQLQNPKVFLLNKISIIQLLTNEVKEYSKYGNDELSVMASYIMSEGEYFSNSFKKKVDLAMIPENLTETKKAIFWHFSLPENVTSTSKNELKALKSVFITSVKNDKIITIATTQFENQKLENIEKFLVYLTKSIDVKNNKDFCRK